MVYTRRRLTVMAVCIAVLVVGAIVNLIEGDEGWFEGICLLVILASAARLAFYFKRHGRH